jgi:hypothetical protein
VKIEKNKVAMKDKEMRKEEITKERNGEMRRNGNTRH